MMPLKECSHSCKWWCTIIFAFIINQQPLCAFSEWAGIRLDIYGDDARRHCCQKVVPLVSNQRFVVSNDPGGGLGRNQYLYQHDRKSFGNRQRISIVSVWKEQALTHWNGFHIHNWLWPESLCSFLCRLITITQSDNRLLSRSAKLSFQQRLLGGEIASHIAARHIPCSYTLSQMLSEIRGLSTIQ